MSGGVNKASRMLTALSFHVFVRKHVLDSVQLNQLTGTTSNYTNDPIQNRRSWSKGATTTESYSYDEVGNRLSSGGG